MSSMPPDAVAASSGSISSIGVSGTINPETPTAASLEQKTSFPRRPTMLL
jgi:hypothetical protein